VEGRWGTGTTNGTKGTNGGRGMCGREELDTGLRGGEGASWWIAPWGMLWAYTGLMGEGFGV
jgi:hypothetical protein